MDEQLARALESSTAHERFDTKIRTIEGSECLWWVGAISGHGHGRFWVATGRVVVAHRFAYGRAHGAAALEAAQVLSHLCDNPLCQYLEHLTPTTNAENRASWAVRRLTPGSPHRDTRGSLGRALAVRQALFDGIDPTAALDAGIPSGDRLDPLF